MPDIEFRRPSCGWKKSAKKSISGIALVNGKVISVEFSKSGTPEYPELKVMLDSEREGVIAWDFLDILFRPHSTQIGKDPKGLTKRISYNPEAKHPLVGMWEFKKTDVEAVLREIKQNPALGEEWERAFRYLLAEN